ncbi:MAG TPA: GAF domain-containing protein, partial [Terriglobales bacterium]|nr:GAF domain-containing protein [Terriglobales bacterium]
QADPANESVCHTAADVLVSIGRNSEAVQLLSNLFERQCDSCEKSRAGITYQKLARIARPTGDQSLRFAHDLAKTSKDALKAYQAALQAFIAKGRKREAVAALDGIVALEPSVVNFRKLGDLAAESGDNIAAATAYLSAGELETDDQAKFVFFERAYKLCATDSRIVLAYGEALLARGDAAAAAKVLEPFAKTTTEAVSRTLYGRALLKAGHTNAAAPFVWESFVRGASPVGEMADVIGSLAAAEETQLALEWARKLQLHEFKAGRRREFVALVKALPEKHTSSIEFLEYMAEVFNHANREHDYCATLLKLFDLHYASGDFRAAADCLDRAAEVDAYESGHQARLETLRGKIGANEFKAIASRLNVTLKGATLAETSTTAELSQPGTTSLDDLVLQAQIYLRYCMRPKAVEKLVAIRSMFPHEEERNPELRELFVAAGMASKYDRPVEIVEDERQSVALSPGHDAMDEIGRMAQITRNVYQQTSVRSVLSSAVNELGRYCKASRCLAVMSTPGKPPSIALEHCGPGLRQSDIHSIVKMVALLQPLLVAHGTIEVSAARKTRPALRPLRKPLLDMGIHSLLAVPLLDGKEHIGMLVLAECDEMREWTANDTGLVSTVAEQVVLAAHNVRLRRLVQDLAVTDENSGLVKRSSYLDVLLAEVGRSVRQNSPLSVMLMTFGAPGQLIERFGRSGVEGVMRHIAELVMSHVRQNDVAVRYDATTIAVMLADTPEQNASLAAEKLRKVAAVAHLPGSDSVPQIAIGVAQTLMEPTYDPADLVTEVVNRAESALARAVEAGGSQTLVLPVPLEHRAASA